MKSVNGVPVKNLEGLVAAVEACKEHFLRFQLEYSQVSIVQEWSFRLFLCANCMPCAEDWADPSSTDFFRPCCAAILTAEADT